MKGQHEYTPGTTDVLFMTRGSLRKKMDLEPNKFVEQFDVVILDEVHDRDVDLEILMLLLSDDKTTPTVMLMSATLRCGELQNYFGGPDRCGTVICGGERKYPVQLFFEPVEIEIYAWRRKAVDLIAKQVEEAMETKRDYAEEWREYERKMKEWEKSARRRRPMEEKQGRPAEPERRLDRGTILVCTPGAADICALRALLRSRVEKLIAESTSQVEFKGPKIEDLSREAERSDIDRITRWAPDLYQVVLATSMGDSSVTLPDVFMVIDAGLTKESSVNDGVSGLDLVEASRSTVEQRIGRTGRTCPGKAYLLYSEVVFDELIAAPCPSIAREDVTDLILEMSAKGIGFEEFFGRLLARPTQRQLIPSIRTLVRLGLWDDKGFITSKGKRARKMGMDYRMASVLVAAADEHSENMVHAAIAVVALLESIRFGLFKFRRKASIDETGKRRENRADKMRHVEGLDIFSGKYKRMCEDGFLNDLGMLYTIARYTCVLTQRFCGPEESREMRRVSRQFVDEFLVDMRVISKAKLLVRELTETVKRSLGTLVDPPSWSEGAEIGTVQRKLANAFKAGYGDCIATGEHRDQGYTYEGLPETDSSRIQPDVESRLMSYPCHVAPTSVCFFRRSRVGTSVYGFGFGLKFPSNEGTTRDFAPPPRPMSPTRGALPYGGDGGWDSPEDRTLHSEWMAPTWPVEHPQGDRRFEAGPSTSRRSWLPVEPRPYDTRGDPSPGEYHTSGAPSPCSTRRPWQSNRGRR